MKKTTPRIPFLLSILSLLWISSCDADAPPDSLIVSSPAFGEDQVIPILHTCFDTGASPAIFIEKPPENTAQFALILEDRDLPEGENTLWIIWGIPESTGSLPHGVPAGSYETGRFRQGRADNKEVGYQPPCPSQGETHRFRFTAFALDSADLEGLDHAVDRDAFDGFIDGHVLATGSLEGVFRGQ